MRCLSQIYIVMLLLAAAVIPAGCRHTIEEHDGILKCDSFEVYPDSIVRGSESYTALSPFEISGAWKLPDSLRPAVSYTSSQRMADALFTKAMSETPDYNPREIALCLGLLQPEKSMEALRQLAAKPTRPDEDFPYSTLIPDWGAAAWEVYCATGSKPWLREAYDTLSKMLARQQKLNTSTLSSLKCGTPRSLTDPSAFYPEWMDDMDRFQTFSSSVNITRAQSLEILSRMAAELRLYAEREHQKQSGHLRDIINDLLWFPDLQRYGQYLYCNYYPIVSSVTDNDANALAILSGIATPEMGAALIGSLPLLPDGIPVTYPATKPDIPMRADIQTLIGLAAARVRNPHVFTHASATLWNMTLTDRHPALWPSLVIKGLFGIRLTPKAMTFKPIVAAEFAGEKTIKGLPYRNATLDITIHGSGDRIVSFTLDSVTTANPEISAELTGHHTAVITLSGNDIQSKAPNIVAPETVAPIPDLKWQSPTEMTITNFNPDLRYGVQIDGVTQEEITTDSYSFPSDRPAVITVVPSFSRGHSGYSPGPHLYTPEKDLITIHASSITPRRPPLHFIKDPATATNYIELAARHNTRITCYANAPEEGDYFLTVGYTSGMNRCALRTLHVNDRYAATLTFPRRQANEWIHVYPSTTAIVHLNEGFNKISLTYIQGTILCNRLTLIRRS